MAATIFVISTLMFLQFPVTLSIDAFLSKPGNISLLILFDIHRTRLDNGSCTDIDYSVLEIAHGINWISTADNFENETVPGFLVFDTCGSQERALQILAASLFEGGCDAGDNYKMAGVFSYTSQAVSDTIENLLAPTGILHMDVRRHFKPSTYVRAQPGSHLLVTLPSKKKVEAAVELLKMLNWTYITTISDNMETTKAERDLLEKTVKARGVCIQDSLTAISGNISLSSIGTKGVVVFMSDNVLAENIANNVPTGSLSLVLGPGVESASLYNGLYVDDDYPSLNSFVKYFSSEARNATDWDQITIEYLVNKHGCLWNTTINILDCQVNSTEQYLLLRTKKRDMHKVLGAYSLLWAAGKHVVNRGCGVQTGVNGCPNLLDAVKIKIGSSEAVEEIVDDAYNISLWWFQQGHAHKVGRFLNDVYEVSNASLQISSMEYFTTSVCSGYCQECSSCQSALNSDIPILLIPGDIFVVASVPVHEAGSECRSWSWKGLEMTEALAYGLNASKSSVFEVGVLVVDSCGSNLEGDLIFSEIERCPFEPSINSTLKVNGRNIAVPISFEESTRSYFRSKTDSRPRFVVTNSGIYFKDLKFDRYISATVALFKELKWSYIAIVHSSDDFSKILLSEFLRAFADNNVCMSSLIKINTGSIQSFMDIPRDSTVVVFLTNEMDTSTSIKTLKNMTRSSLMHYIFYPWNQDNPESSIFNELPAGSILIQPYQNPSDAGLAAYLNALTGYNNNRNPWWSRFHKTLYGCEINASPESFAQICDNSTRTVTKLRSNPMSFYVKQMMRNIVSSLQNLAGSLCLNGVVPCDKFREKILDPTTNLSDFISLSEFYNNGEMKVPLQFSNYQTVNSTTITAIRVAHYDIFGKFTSDGSNWMLQNSKGDFVKSESVCKGWCPRCVACNGSLKPTQEFFHIPGDVLLTGFFPIRNAGDVTLSCGTYAVQRGSATLADAFLFAIRTFRDIFPRILPNVSVGSLIMDTCSNAALADQMLLNFETCHLSLSTEYDSHPPSPFIVPGYIIQGTTMETQSTRADIQRINKLGIFVDDEGILSITSTGSILGTNMNSSFHAVIEFVYAMNWDYVSLITSGDNYSEFNSFRDMAMMRNICIDVHSQISSSNLKSYLNALDVVRNSSANVVIVFASDLEIRSLFQPLVSQPSLLKTWIVSKESRTSVRRLGDLLLPLGSILIQSAGTKNTAFQTYSSSLESGNPSVYTGNPWLQKFATAGMVQNGDLLNSTASVIIKSVFITLHAIDAAYSKLCPLRDGLCKDFAQEGNAETLKQLKNVVFDYQGEKVNLVEGSINLALYTLYNSQTKGFQPIGTWKEGVLEINKAEIKSYDSNIFELPTPRNSKCYTNCRCINIKEHETPVLSISSRPYGPDRIYEETTAAFIPDLWRIIVLIIACSGAAITLILLIYILSKVCTGALIRRYIILGVLLLAAIVFLFMSIFPFLFSPSEPGCGMRFFAHGFSYAFAFAIILTKMMTLREYRYIGLGGEISRLNQILSVFFLTGVQIAIGVQWWVLKTPLFVEEKHLRVTGNISENITYYACEFQRDDFVAYNVFVMLLIVICSLYGILVRNESKNMGEARLLLICSWTSVGIWTAWIIVLFVLPRQHSEFVVSIEMLVSAVSMLAIIYLPKLTTIAKLKYDVSERESGEKSRQNGYKIDSGFHFERPYSLPETLDNTDSFLNKYHGYPRSLQTFDTSLSY
ncbi:hypothetical protein ACJMK2_016966 [Sinanodonta woodiana]|uniref:G-protein coupled receptors family 3 profile domain-containing protein n=1 Tax=Sinanodonta woodiana TaxID=1069815 RepID=A0ABD3UVE2_SINWO